MAANFVIQRQILAMLGLPKVENITYSTEHEAIKMNVTFPMQFSNRLSLIYFSRAWIMSLETSLLQI